jgi:hypothetical protein
MMAATTIRQTLLSLLFLFFLSAASSPAGQFVVRSTADAGAHSLRWAILQANASAGPDVISFEIPGSGPLTIVPASPLPALTDPAGTIIDGLSQEGCSAGAHPPATLTLRVVLDGVHAGRAPGLWLQSSNNLIQGLVITRFAEDGVRIQGMDGGTRGNTVRNCIIGLDPAGIETRPNCMDEHGLRFAGVRMFVDQATAGDVFENAVLTCVISGNQGDGILITDCPGTAVYTNTVSGNFIGCTLSGDVPRGNARDGVHISGGCYDNIISANVIGGNRSDGIHLIGDAARKAIARNNSIGRNHVGITLENHPIGNAVNGINLGGREYGSPGGFAANNIVTSNTVAANGRSGIVVWEHPSTTDNADRNRLTQNNVFGNGRLGIDLGDDGVSLNDLADRDVGPNQNRNAPVLLSADINEKLVMLRGNIDLGSLRREAKVELYKMNGAVAPQSHDALYLGTVAPDADGNWVYSTSGGLFEGDSVTAIVIDADGNTSEFARPRAVLTGDVYEEVRSEVAEEHRINGHPSAVIASTLQNRKTGEVTFTIDVEKDCWTIMEIFTEQDELVHTLLNRWINAGRHTVTWDGSNWKGAPVPPGSYSCRLEAGGVRQTKILARRATEESQ